MRRNRDGKRGRAALGGLTLLLWFVAAGMAVALIAQAVARSGLF